MLSMEDWAEIRRLSKSEGLSIKEIDLDHAIEMRSVVLQSLEEQRRRADDFTCATNLVVTFGSHATRSAWEGCKQLSGGAENITERLVAIGCAGFSVFIVALAGPDAIDRFATEVIPQVLTKCPRSILTRSMQVS